MPGEPHGQRLAPQLTTPLQLAPVPVAVAQPLGLQLQFTGTMMHPEPNPSLDAAALDPAGRPQQIHTRPRCEVRPLGQPHTVAPAVAHLGEQQTAHPGLQRKRDVRQDHQRHRSDAQHRPSQMEPSTPRRDTRPGGGQAQRRPAGAGAEAAPHTAGLERPLGTEAQLLGTQPPQLDLLSLQHATREVQAQRGGPQAARSEVQTDIAPKPHAGPLQLEPAGPQRLARGGHRPAQQGQQNRE